MLIVGDVLVFKVDLQLCPSIHPSNTHPPVVCWTRLGWEIDSPRRKVVLGAKVFDNLVQWLLLIHVHDAEQLLVWFPFDGTHLACRCVQVLRFLCVFSFAA